MILLVASITYVLDSADVGLMEARLTASTLAHLLQHTGRATPSRLIRSVCDAQLPISQLVTVVDGEQLVHACFDSCDVTFGTVIMNQNELVCWLAT